MTAPGASAVLLQKAREWANQFYHWIESGEEIHREKVPVLFVELHKIASLLEALAARIEALEAAATQARETLGRTAASLVAATDLLRSGGREAVASDKMFKQMLQDYDAAFRAALAALDAAGRFN